MYVVDFGVLTRRFKISHDCRFARRPAARESSARALCFALVLLAFTSALLASPAAATTRISKITYTSDVTWTAASGPYILDGDVTVAESATLTIEPGVVVKMNGQYRMLRVQGRLAALGSPQQRVIFTSIQDDSVGGDTGGDGPTSGAKGQWRQIYATAGGSVDLKYATVRYGGYDCCGTSTSYGVVYAYGGSSVAADQALFIDNQHSAVRVAASCTAGCSPKATITNSVITRNGGGVSTLNAAADIRNSRIRENDGRGVNYMLSASYSYPTSQLTDNDITRNGSYGVYFWIEKAVPSALWPHGQRNNIWDNAVNEAAKIELWSLDPRRDIDWTGNFWGSLVEFRDNAAGCESAAPAAAGRLVYGFGGIADPGPFRSRGYLGKTADGKDILCYYDYLRVERDQFSRTYILHSGGPIPATEPDPAAALARLFRPSLRFDGAETYRPLHVDQFFSERNDQGQPFHEVCNTAGCIALTSKADLPGDPDSYLDIAGDGDADNFHSPYAECTENDMRDCDGGPRSAIYYWQTSPPGSSITYIDYWIFYRYSDWPWLVLGDLEGDWESVTVGTSSPGATTFDFASFSQHGTWYSYLRENLSCEGGEPGSCGAEARRLTVYPAQGSHANYPTRCTSDNCDRNGDVPLGEGRHDGAAPWGNDNDGGSLLPLEDPDSTGSWTGWVGDWGEGGGPASPAQGGNGNHFRSPWTSTCADNNDDCVVLARRRGSAPSARAAAVRGNDRCGTWLGAGVVAAACTPPRIRAAIARRGIGHTGSLKLTTRAGGKRYHLRAAASASGVAQALGEPLRPGQRLALQGRSSRSTELLVRAGTSSHLVTARFTGLGLAGERKATVLVQRRGKIPTLTLATSGGRRVSPASVRTTRLRVLKRPQLKHVRRLADGRISVAYTTGTRTVVLQALGQRRRVVFERGLKFRHAGMHRAVTSVPRTARRLELRAVDSRGTRSSPVIVGVPR